MPTPPPDAIETLTRIGLRRRALNPPGPIAKLDADVWQVPSSAGGDKVYRVTVSGASAVSFSCECLGFHYTAGCSHGKRVLDLMLAEGTLTLDRTTPGVTVIRRACTERPVDEGDPFDGLQPVAEVRR